MVYVKVIRSLPFAFIAHISWRQDYISDYCVFGYYCWSSTTRLTEILPNAGRHEFPEIFTCRWLPEVISY